MTLFFLYAPGCTHCKAAEPIVRAAIAKHPDVQLIQRNAELDGTVLGWTPKGTPSYALVDRGELIAEHTGTMTETQLERWLMQQPEPRKRKARRPERGEEEEEADAE